MTRALTAAALVATEPVDFERDVRRRIAGSHWRALTPPAQEAVAQALTRYREAPRLALLAALRGALTTNALAAAAGVAPRTMRQWRAEQQGFMDDLELMLAIAQARLEKRQHDVSLGVVDGTRNEVRNRQGELAARDPETYGPKLDLTLNLGDQNRERDQSFFDDYDAYERGRRAANNPDIIEGEARTIDA